MKLVTGNLLHALSTVYVIALAGCASLDKVSRDAGFTVTDSAGTKSY